MSAIEVVPLPARVGAEVVERKGVGHPDTMSDGLADALGVALCREYLARFGAVLHHNVDKALLAGGASRPRFGGGEVVEPAEVILAGRATTDVGGARVDLDAIVREVVARWLRDHLRYVDPARHVRVGHRVRAGSADLTALFSAGDALANDTSIGVGHAPRSPLEAAVLAAEGALARERAAWPALGEDTKVLGVERAGARELTVAVAMVDRHLGGGDDYEAARARAKAAVERAVPGAAVAVNVADDPARGRYYLTVTGTSLEAGDDGQVGRGNRVSGLITPCRPMSLEAAAGKNPVTHVGKLYNLVASRAASRVAGLPGVREAECLLVSRIGRPVRDPWLAEVRVRVDGGAVPPEVRRGAEEALRAELDALPALSLALAEGRAPGY